MSFAVLHGRWAAPALFVMLCSVLLAGCQAPRFGALVAESRIGWRDDTFYGLDALLANAMRSTQIPGGQLAVTVRGELVYAQYFGGDGPFRRERFDDTTPFDVASLTKPLVGVAAVSRARVDGKLDADEWRKALLLLRHRSGIDDAVEYPRVMQDLRVLEELLGDVSEAPVDCYSNVGYAVLALLLERQGMHGRGTRAAAGGRAALTGWKSGGEPVRGTPFDPLAERMLAESGVVPLHSGHFSTAATEAQWLSNALVGETSFARVYRALLVEGVTSAPSCIDGEPVHRSAGGLESMTSPPWAPEGAGPGRYFLQDGFTGCFLWIDAGGDTAVVLLTNAVSTDSFDEARALMGSVVTLIRGAAR